MKAGRTWACLVLLAALATSACAGRQRSGEPEVLHGEPEIERIEAPLDGQSGLPPHVLVCGYHKNLELPLEVTTYQSETGLSLYDFAHDGRQLETWMRLHPGGRAWGLRQHHQDKGPSGAIGRQLGEPCFGNGARAVDVIRQIVVVRAGGADASEALHNLLRTGRSAHFVVDRDGTVHQALDPVHAAVAPEPHANVAIYVAVVTPRRVHEWLPSVLTLGGSEGAVGALAGHTAGDGAARAAQSRAVPAPEDVFAARERCSVSGQTVLSETVTAAQERALAGLMWALADEYPSIKLEVPIARDGSALREHMSDSLYHAGILTDYHVRAESREPACLDLARILALE